MDNDHYKCKLKKIHPKPAVKRGRAVCATFKDFLCANVRAFARISVTARPLIVAFLYSPPSATVNPLEKPPVLAGVPAMRAR